MKKKIKLIAAIILAVLVLAFVLQNTHGVPTKLLVWERQPPYALVLVIAIIVGFLIGLLTANQLTGRQLSITMKPVAPQA